MGPSSRLLVATDLSGPSLRAVDRAFELARESGAACTVLHAMGMDLEGAWRELLGEQAETVSARAVERQRAALERLVAASDRHRGVRVDVRVERGFATDAVPASAESLDAALVVVGAHGHGFLQRVLLGSTSSTLLRKSRRPVLVVKAPTRGPYRRALIPVDFSPGSEAALRFLLHALPRTERVLLHAFDVPLESMLRHDACDLVVMGKHGTHVTEELLLGSVTKRVLAESHADVLVVVDDRRPHEPIGA